MARQLKCQWCLEYDDKPEMIQDKKMYFHINNCYESFLEEKKNKENAKQFKCQSCLKYDYKPVLIQEDGMYFHIENCHEVYLEHKRFKKEERQELDLLASIIVKVHKLNSIQSIPTSFYPIIQEVRNDSVLFGIIMKKYKKGVSYELIGQTYLYCADKISWAKSNKDFKNELIRELKYGLAIIKSNIENTIRDNSKKFNSTAQDDKIVKNIDMMANVGERMKEAQKNMKKDHIDVTDIF